MELQLNENFKLKQVLSKIRNRRKKVAAIHSEFSSFPDGIEAHFDFYQKIILNEDLPLCRTERELLAVLTSDENSCEYCVKHHKEALKNFDFEVKEERLLFYRNLVITLSKEPWKSSIYKQMALDVGLSEAEYAHAVMVIGYFNMANRLVFALNIQLEEDFEESCQQ